jgi:hypothetical protein
MRMGLLIMLQWVMCSRFELEFCVIYLTSSLIAFIYIYIYLCVCVCVCV